MELHTAGASEFPKYVRWLVAGYTGSGKTSFATTAPNPLWLAASPGMTTLALKGGVRYIDITSEEDLFKIKELLLTEPEKFGAPVETLVVDTVDELQRRLLQGRLDKERRSEVKADDWNWIAARLNRIFEGLNELPVHIIYTAHLKELGGFDDNYIVKPSIQGGFVDQIHNHVEAAFWIRSAGYWQANNELVLENSDDSTDATTLTSAGDSTYVSRNALTSAPTLTAEWVHDHTGTVPDDFVLNFVDDFDRLLALRGEVSLSESTSVSLEPEPVPVDDTPAELPGSSSNAQIAEILKQRKANKANK